MKNVKTWFTIKLINHKTMFAEELKQLKYLGVQITKNLQNKIEARMRLAASNRNV